MTLWLLFALLWFWFHSRLQRRKKNRDWNKWNANLWSGRAQLYGLNKSTKKCRACGNALYVMNILCVTLQSGLVFKVVVFLNIGNVCFYLFAVKIMTFIKYLINVNWKILCNKKVRSELSGLLPLPCSFFLDFDCFIFILFVCCLSILISADKPYLLIFLVYKIIGLGSQK